jgi:hypothetical protein
VRAFTPQLSEQRSLEADRSEYDQSDYSKLGLSDLLGRLLLPSTRLIIICLNTGNISISETRDHL